MLWTQAPFSSTGLIWFNRDAACWICSTALTQYWNHCEPHPSNLSIVHCLPRALSTLDRPSLRPQCHSRSLPNGSPDLGYLKWGQGLPSIARASRSLTRDQLPDTTGSVIQLVTWRHLSNTHLPYGAPTTMTLDIFGRNDSILGYLTLWIERARTNSDLEPW